MKLPLALVDGDVAELVATVHNDLIKEGTIHVTLKTTIGSWINEETKTVEVKNERDLRKYCSKRRSIGVLSSRAAQVAISRRRLPIPMSKHLRVDRNCRPGD